AAQRPNLRRARSPRRARARTRHVDGGRIARMAARRRPHHPGRHRTGPARAPGAGPRSARKPTDQRRALLARHNLCPMRVLILSHDDVHKALTPEECADAMAAVLAGLARGEAFMPLRSIMAPPGPARVMGPMPGWRGARAPDAQTPDEPGSAQGGDAQGRDAQGGDADIDAHEHALPEPPPPDKAVFALKAICLMPGNPARGLDAHQGLVALF